MLLGKTREQGKEAKPSYKMKFQESLSIAVGLMLHWDPWIFGHHPSVWFKSGVNDALRCLASSRAVKFYISVGSLGLNLCMQNG